MNLWLDCEGLRYYNPRSQWKGWYEEQKSGNGTEGLVPVPISEGF